MKIKWGIIGCGGIAFRRTIPGLMLANNAELVAVMDTNFDAAKQVQAEFGAKYAFDNVDDVLALDEIDAVYIATPVFCHKEQAIKAAQAKKHILIEKPIGLDMKESEEIIHACCQNGVKMGVGLMMRFHSLHQKMKNIIANGEIGDIVSARAQFTCWYPKMDNAWRQKKALSGGGAMMDMGIHCADLMRYISGMEPIKISAMTANTVFDYEVEDSGCIMMRMQNGAICVVEANFNIPDEAGMGKLEFYGSKGCIIAKGTLGQEDVGTIEIIRCDSKEYDAAQHRTESEKEVISALGGNMYTKEIESFGNSILTNSACFIPPEDAVLSQKIIEESYLNS